MKSYNKLCVSVGVAALAVAACDSGGPGMLLLDPDASARDASVYAAGGDDPGEQAPLDVGPQATWDARIVDAGAPQAVDPGLNDVAGDSGTAPEPEAPTCEQACRRVVQCDLAASDSVPGCVDHCRASGSEAERRCVLSAECDAVEPCLGDAPVHPPVDDGVPDCRDTCESLVGCDLVLPGDLSACVDACDADNSPAERQCLTEAGCDLGGVQACFEAPADPRPPAGAAGCQAVCGGFVDCGFIPPGDFADCVDGCDAESTPAELDCLSGAGCDADGAQACFDAPADPGPPGGTPDCRNTCGGFVDCGFILPAELVDCVDGCELESTPRERRCLAEAGCDETSAGACF